MSTFRSDSGASPKGYPMYAESDYIIFTFSAFPGSDLRKELICFEKIQK